MVRFAAVVLTLASGRATPRHQEVTAPILRHLYSVI